jgi:hypothetical protein
LPAGSSSTTTNAVCEAAMGTTGGFATIWSCTSVLHLGTARPRCSGLPSSLLAGDAMGRVVKSASCDFPRRSSHSNGVDIILALHRGGEPRTGHSDALFLLPVGSVPGYCDEAMRTPDSEGDSGSYGDGFGWSSPSAASDCNCDADCSVGDAGIAGAGLDWSSSAANGDADRAVGDAGSDGAGLGGGSTAPALASIRAITLSSAF